MAGHHSLGSQSDEFDEATIALVWIKARIVPGYDPTQFRHDVCGAWIERDQYGKTSNYGWEIDHIKPRVKGGTSEYSNLQPLHWQNNRGKGDDYPNWNCTV